MTRQGPLARPVLSGPTWARPREAAPLPSGRNLALRGPFRALRPPVPWPFLLRQARQRFGVEQLRPGQFELIEAALHGRDALGILPTGAGKSLCFQLPALVVPQAVVVVSPLIALMRDQTEHLAHADITAVELDSSLRPAELAEAQARVATGAEVVYVTPERLEHPGQLALLRQRGVSLLVVDEAHCISQWGHDFRPAYLAVRHAVAALGRPPVLALTATATREVAQDVVHQLGLRDPLVVRGSIARDNLFLSVVATPTLDDKRQALRRLVQPYLGPAGRAGSVLIYCATVRETEAVAQWLEQAGIPAETYHARRASSARAVAQDRFMTGAARVLVATKAFGMGIDKPDVRLVVHWQLPDSPESYWQEGGRAGRDGEPAQAVLLYRPEDRRVQDWFLRGRYPRPEDVLGTWRALRDLHDGQGEVDLEVLSIATGLSTRVLRVVAALLEDVGVAQRSASDGGPLGLRPVRDFAAEAERDAALQAYAARQVADDARLLALLSYAESKACRMQTLAGWFGEAALPACGRCDNCLQGEVVLPGQTVRHRRFGSGRVQALQAPFVAVRFDRAGLRHVLRRSLR